MSFPERYSRQISLKGFGAESQQKLQNAKVLVVGAGGLGVPALQYLVGMGVGFIGIVDGDTVSASNLNRQILYNETEVGLPKAELAKSKLSKQNTFISIQSFSTYLTVDNAIDIIRPFDLVIDATDNFATRYLINDACVILGKPFVYGAIQQYEGHVSVFNYQGGPTYRCLYPNIPSQAEIPDCNMAGVLGVVPGIIGCQQALEAIKIITGIGKKAAGSIRIFDLLNNDQYEMKLKAKPQNLLITELEESYENATCSSIPILQSKQLFDWITLQKEFLLMDVREPEEHQQGYLQNSILNSLSRFNPNTLSPVKEIPVVTYCKGGGRSIKAATLLLQKNSHLNIFSLEGGMDQWVKEMGNKLVIS